MNGITTERLNAKPVGIRRAADILRVGGLVAFPTETVFGLGANARNGQAVARIFQAKGRPRFNPLIVHIASQQAARDIGEFGDAAERLTNAFWPGPLTLVLPLRKDAGLSELVTAGLPTIGLRLPDHPAAKALLSEFGAPIAAPSANPSGKISPTSAKHVAAGLGGRINAILDAGPCNVGLESTIIGFEPIPTLLRPGGLPIEAIEHCLGRKLALPAASDTPNAPGQLASHYAPITPLHLNAEKADNGGLKLGFGPDNAADLNLSPSGDLVDAAANLFHHLHQLDAKGAPFIAVAPIPNHGLGLAINDRLKRAATPSSF